MKRTMKSLLVAVVAILAVTSLNAQENKLTFGVKAGMNLSNFTGDADMDAKIGFNAGVTMDYAITNEMYVLTGLELNSKGAKQSLEGDKVTMNLLYLQLPVHFGYKLQVAEATKLVFHAGPYVGFGVAGKSSATVDGEKVKEDSFGDEGFKRFDFGLGLGVGAEFGKIGVGLGYDFGLLNIIDADGASVKNGNFYVSVGYKF